MASSLKIFSDIIVRTGLLEIQARPVVDNRTIIKTTKLKVQSFNDDLLLRPARLINNAVRPIDFQFPISATYPFIVPINRNKSTNDLIVSTRKLEPYEKLTGISHERPEIILMSTFQPVFLNDNVISNNENSDKKFMMTDVGLFIDSQIQARNLQYSNIFNTLNPTNDEFSKEIEERNAELSLSLTKLNANTDFLLTLIKKMDRVKSQLDLRNDLYTVNPTKIVLSHNLDFTQTEFSENFNSLQNIAQKLPTTYSIIDIFELFGYKRKNILNVFSSTKLWLQLLYEFKGIIKNHSFELLNLKRSSQKNDKNASVILKDPTKFFNIKPIDPVGILEVEQISKQEVSNLATISKHVQTAFVSIYQNASFETEELKIAALANTLCKEYSYSKGLVDKDVVDSLNENYQYVVSTTSNNLPVFDNVIGKFPDNIVSVSKVASDSLAALGQQNGGKNIAILPFETKYVEGDSGHTTPGSAWYIDQVLNLKGTKFDVEHLDEFSEKLRTAYKNFSTFANKMNLYSVSSFDNTTKKSNRDYSSSLLEPVRFVNYITDFFVDKRNGKTHQFFLDDKIASLYSFANQSSTIKSLLFLLTMNQLARSYGQDLKIPGSQIDNTPFTEEVIKAIARTLGNITKASTVKKTSSEITISNTHLKSALRKGTITTVLINSVMLSVYNEFKRIGAFNLSSRTMYSGHLDTVVMMNVFDIIISIVAKYSNQTITGRRVITMGDKQANTFIITTQNTIFLDSLNNMFNKMNRESTIIQQVLWSIIGTPKSLSKSLTKFSNFLKDSSTTTNMTKIAQLIPNQDELKFLLSEQQIMMMVSNVNDVLSKFQSTQHDPLNVASTGSEIRVIDDVHVPSNLKNIFYELMNQRQYSTSKAINKKILTIGLPLDFTRRFKQKSQIATQQSINTPEKQSDIIKLLVYKVDALNQDITFKPKEFLFELSRFPVRDYTKYGNVDSGATITDILSVVPTRDFIENLEESVNINSISFFKKNSLNESLDASSYNFLNFDQKTEIIRNHVWSLMLELYIKFLNGITINEQNFNIQNSGIVEQLITNEFGQLTIENNIRDILKTQPAAKTGSSQGVLFSFFNSDNSLLRLLQGQFQSVFSTVISSINDKNISRVVNAIENVRQVATIKTNVSDGELLTKSILRPKQFDRVFNIIIDPDDFVIDTRQTLKSEYGRQLFTQLLKRGDLTSAAPVGFKFRDKDVTRGSATLDKYFVAIGSIEVKS